MVLLFSEIDTLKLFRENVTYEQKGDIDNERSFKTGRIGQHKLKMVIDYEAGKVRAERAAELLAIS